MKKFVSIALAIMMTASLFTPVSAASVSDLLGSMNGQTLYVQMEVETLARENGDGEYTSDLSLDGAVQGTKVDYQSKLDMAPIRNLFDKDVINTILSDDAAQTEFNNGTVTSEIRVTVTYPADAEFSGDIDSDTVGSIDNNNFTETSRTVTDNALTISYRNKDNLTVSELSEKKAEILADITFTLENYVSYKESGNHSVNVRLDGTTSINFTSGIQTVHYYGNASCIVNVGEVNHALEVVPLVPATCTKTGTTEGVRCTTHDGYNCGAPGVVAPQTIQMLSHSYSEMYQEVSATCAITGVKAHKVCLMCKGTFNANDEAIDVVIAKTLHTHSNNDIYKEATSATCTQDGKEASYKCDNYENCGYVFQGNVIKASGHTIVEDDEVKATCTEAGKTSGSHCSKCDSIIVAQRLIPAKGHDWSEWEVTKEPTETAVGSKTRTCKNDDNHKDTVEIPKLEHVCKINESLAVITKKATCTEAGEKQNYCACGEAVGAPVVIPATGHSRATDHVEGKAETCCDTGIIEHWSCTNCGKLFSDEALTKEITNAIIPINSTKHVEDKITVLPAIAPTCLKDGLTEGKKCTACNVITQPQEIAPKTGHTMLTVPAEAATCTAAGTIAHDYCSVCELHFATGETKAREAAYFKTKALGHSYGDVEVITPATEQAAGTGKRVCSRCADEKEVTIAKLQHVHNAVCEEVVNPATCIQDGLAKEIYTCCGEVKTDNIAIPKTGHTVENTKKVDAVPSTCYTQGIPEYYYCEQCKQSFSLNDGVLTPITNFDDYKSAKLDHDFGDPYNAGDYECRECNNCNEVVKVKKDQSINDVNYGGIKSEADKVKEDRLNDVAGETGRDVEIQSTINVKKTVNISQALNDAIENARPQKAGSEKLIYDILIEKVTNYVDSQSSVVEVDKEIVRETNELVTIVINIPEEMKDYIDFLVYRRHIDNNGNVTNEPITIYGNRDNERIEIAANKSTITLYVKKFSEYAVVGYEERVNVEPVTPPVGGGGGISTFTVKFNANGGIVVKDVKVNYGQKITAPITSREGYVLEGWYSDSSFTKKFDFNTAIKSNMTLYAKWVEKPASTDCPGTVEGGCPSVHFTDVNATAWYHSDIDYVVSKNLMNGVEDNAFAPNSPLTRAMLVTILYRADGEPAVNKSIPFNDVDMGGYYANAVIWAKQNGIVSGHTETEFAPNDNITREQIAAIMHRYAKYKSYDVTVGENTNILSYDDAASISEYAVSAMQYAVGSGLMTGRTDSTLNPKDNTTRAEIAAILHRFFEAHK